jgi:SAM-dependent methyltransferase
MTTIEDPAYFATLAEVERVHWWSLGMWWLTAHWLEIALRGRSGLVALDVGCGTGFTTARLARVPGVARVFGVEPSPDALGHARGHATPLARGTALALPFADASFDLVTCLDVLQHLPAGTDGLAAQEIARVLRPGGVALVRSNGRGLLNARGANPRPYRLEEICGTMSASGLHVRRATYANCLPSLAQEIRGRLARGRSHPAGGGLRIRVPGPAINRIMGAIAAIEALVAGRLNRKLPFGHSTLLLAERAA